MLAGDIRDSRMSAFGSGPFFADAAIFNADQNPLKVLRALATIFDSWRRLHVAVDLHFPLSSEELGR